MPFNYNNLKELMANVERGNRRASGVASRDLLLSRAGNIDSERAASELRSFLLSILSSHSFPGRLA
jgi:hypothetical protein